MRFITRTIEDASTYDFESPVLRYGNSTHGLSSTVLFYMFLSCDSKIEVSYPYPHVLELSYNEVKTPP